MTNNIAFLDDHRPHIRSSLICNNCEKRWEGVYADTIKLKDISCPNCKFKHVRLQSKYEMAFGGRVEPKVVLLKAMNEDLQDVIVLGRNKDGEFHMAGSSGKIEKDIFTLEKAKHELLQIVGAIDEGHTIVKI